MVIRWFIPLGLSIFIGYVLQAILLKRLADRDSRSTAQFVGFCGAAGLALIFGLLRKAIILDSASLTIIAIGFVNALAARAHVEATRINMTFASVFLVLDDVLAMTLAWFILNEGKFFTPIIATGVTLAIETAMFFAIYKGKKVEIKKLKDEIKTLKNLTKKPESETIQRLGDEWKLVLYVLAFSLTWGVAIFSMRYFNVGPVQLPASRFLWCWYSGAVLGAGLIYFFDKKNQSKMSTLQTIEAFGLSLTMITSLGCTYWSLSYANKPQIGLQPLYLIAGMILPTLLGLFYFKEIESFDWNERFLLGLAATAGLIISLGLGI
jgi:hypothetical protein